MNVSLNRSSDGKVDAYGPIRIDLQTLTFLDDKGQPIYGTLQTLLEQYKKELIADKKYSPKGEYVAFLVMNPPPDPKNPGQRTPNKLYIGTPTRGGDGLTTNHLTHVFSFDTQENPHQVLERLGWPIDMHTVTANEHALTKQENDPLTQPEVAKLFSLKGTNPTPVQIDNGTTINVYGAFKIVTDGTAEPIVQGYGQRLPNPAIEKQVQEIFRKYSEYLTKGGDDCLIVCTDKDNKNVTGIYAGTREMESSRVWVKPFIDKNQERQALSTPILIDVENPAEIVAGMLRVDEKIARDAQPTYVVNNADTVGSAHEALPAGRLSPEKNVKNSPSTAHK